MYFLWKRTPHGNIKVSCDGLSGFIDRILTEKSKCRGLSLAEGDSASVTLVLSSEDSVSKGHLIEERISSIIAPLGFCVTVIWVDRGAPEAEWCETLLSLYQNPWFWMLVVAMLTLGILAGLKGLFWTLFWGTAAWFVSRFIISLAVRKRLGFFPAVRR
jgi:hypothetical protein